MPQNYRLYAVVMHIGSSCHSGHYVTYARAPNRRWYEFDDIRVREVGVRQVINAKSAYMVLYELDQENTKILPSPCIGISFRKSENFQMHNPIALNCSQSNNDVSIFPVKTLLNFKLSGRILSLRATIQLFGLKNLIGKKLKERTRRKLKELKKRHRLP